MLQLILLITSVVKMWMFYEAAWLHHSYFWAAVVMIVPGGEWVYFLVTREAQVLNAFPFLRKLNQSLEKLLKPGPSLETLRRNAQQAPSVANQQALAAKMLELERWGQAAEEYQRLLGSESDSHEALLGCATAFFQLGQYAAAEERLRKLVSLKPGYRDYAAVIMLSETLQRSERTPEAVILLRSMTRSSQRLCLRVELAALLVKTGTLDEARQLLSEVLLDYRDSPAFTQRLERPWYRWAKRLQRENGLR